MKDIIVSTWGIGPSYRKRVIHNIEKAINTGYDKILPYIILTDKVEDFDELRVKYPDKIIDVVDINKMRDKYSPWSKDFEDIPKATSEKEFGKEYRETNYNTHKRFSYGLHRFVLPRIAELGYTKFLFCDSDTDILYNKIMDGTLTEGEFWEEFNTPVNTMKGCDFEVMEFAKERPWHCATIILGNILRYLLKQSFPEYCRVGYLGYLKITHTQTEGPFRLYHFDNINTINEYFRLWDEATKLALSNQEFRNQVNPGVYMYIDNIMITVTNEMLGIIISGFSKEVGRIVHKVNIYKEDRYFFPMGVTYTIENGEFLSLQIADTKEEFYKINKPLIDYLRKTGQWDE